MPAAGGGGGPSSGTANDAAAATGRLISTSGRVELPRVLTGDSLGLTSVTILVRAHVCSGTPDTCSTSGQ